MKIRLSGASRSLAMTAFSAVIHSAVAQEVIVDGAVDGSFSPSPGTGQSVLSLSYDATGDIIATGNFSAIKDRDSDTLYTSRNRIAKFTNAGVLTSYAPTVTAPNASAIVINSTQEPDGKVLYAGMFVNANSTTRSLVARYHPDGALDTTFTLASNWSGLSSITSVARHLDGYLLLADAGMVRIKLNGANDPDFTTFGVTTASATVQAGGNYLLQGPFGWVPNTGVNNNYLELLKPNGTAITPAFTPDPALTAQVYCSAVQADGRILVGGSFGPKNGYWLDGLTRLMPDGSIDTAFRDLHRPLPVVNVPTKLPFLDGAVRSIAIQADGRILIAGDFTTIRNPVEGGPRIIRRGLARLYPDGSFDSTFDAKIDAVAGATPRVFGITLHADGRILIYGEFQRFDGNTIIRPRVARLTNYSATQNLSYADGVIRWERGGSAPEPQYVVFEHQSLETDFEWVPVDTDGLATRDGTTSNWTKTVTTPLAPGSLIRASGRVACSQFNASTSIVSSTIGYMIPKLSLTRDEPYAPIVNNATTAFPTAGIGSPEDVAFTLQNIGEGEMTTVQPVLSGTNASEFSVVIPPSTPIDAGDSSMMLIRFNPTSTGPKTAVVTLNTSDPLAPTLRFTITATAITAIEQFRLTYFNTTANTGDAADDKDPDGDGLTNYFEFVAGMIPTNRTSAFTCRVDTSGAQPRAIFGPCLNDRTYEVWTSTTLNGDWTLASGSITVNGTQRTFTDSDTSATKRFYRVKIIRP